MRDPVLDCRITYFLYVFKGHVEAGGLRLPIRVPACDLWFEAENVREIRHALWDIGRNEERIVKQAVFGMLVAPDHPKLSEFLKECG
jgi:hypothetical protein